MDKKKIVKAIKLILEAIGEDPERPGLKKTPARVAAMYEEIFAGLGKNPEKVLQVFVGEGHDEIVLVKDIPLYSICEHHLLPFFGKAHVAYIPRGKRVTGLSKLSRVVGILSRRPQLQERLTTSIAETLMKGLRPQGVLVVVEAEHLCMSMRGVKNPGALTITSAVRGIFKENEKTRAETLTLITERR
ncbi:MAG: GTP cyclohydrolase I FolE [Nitrospirae bacterium]|nr:GTP cyclohydrolase I FolE [Nitrospirota bacterium]